MVKFIRGGAALRESLTRSPSIVAMRALLARAAESLSAGGDVDRVDVDEGGAATPSSGGARELVYAQAPQ